MKINETSRRNFIKNLASLSAGVSLGTTNLWGIPKYLPNRSLLKKTINGVQLGLITYSFRALKDQSAEATLQYILDCGVNFIELMGETAESFIGRPKNKINKRTYHSLSRKKRNNSLSKDEEKELGELKKQQNSYDKEVLTWKKKRSISFSADATTASADCIRERVDSKPALAVATLASADRVAACADVTRVSVA